ncbi:cwf18 pre-mRNA splicing factor [Microthyrium microscopicum]|uniref:Cwf18 pre-mRNA splicing factor n=1 Tax=Microthyrium microscopicum TaxID=703497 RepID=A0A6A6U2I6_9PEZI|nr:cwf18 pre-mRNA splicing factor [Microthyrium microscopicum]
MSSSQTTLASAAQDRKARLAQLRSLKRKQPEPSDDEPSQTLPSEEPTSKDTAETDVEDVKLKYLSGRNYDHSTGGAKLGFEHAPNENQDTVEKQAELLAERIRQEAKEEDKKDEPLDLFKLQPKKPNWDLKRDLKQRMQVLDVRTDNAIARLVRERIEAQNKKAGTSDGAGLEGPDLVEAVHVKEREEEEEAQREREYEQEMENGD